MGGHLVHLVHWLHDEKEKGGVFGTVGIVVGLIVGYLSVRPVMHPTALCAATGSGRDVFGKCPDVLDVERLVSILVFGVVFGLVAILIGWLATGREPGT